MNEDKCKVCNGTQIETVRVKEPDGEGGFDWVSEDRPCPACQ
ncbi:hypothetical protein [Paenibacillus sp. Mc5Re-14]|nr:hypothetical protein [Paenibacillus sp. Mc5Re-14]